MEFDDLIDEQNSIDKILNFLIHYKENKKGPGRPSSKSKEKSKEENLQKVPDNVSESFRSIKSINDIHGGILLDYLMKVNSLNKKLLSHCNNLTKKYGELNDKLKNISETPIQKELIVNNETSTSTPTYSTTSAPPTEERAHSKNKDKEIFDLRSHILKSITS